MTKYSKILIDGKPLVWMELLNFFLKEKWIFINTLRYLRTLYSNEYITSKWIYYTMNWWFEAYRWTFTKLLYTK